MNRGGAERQVVTLAAALRAQGHEPVVALFYAGGPLQAELEAAGVRVVPLEKRGRWDLFGFLRRLVALVRRERPDCLHPYLGIPNMLCVLGKPFWPQTPVVWGLRMSYMDMARYDRFQQITYRIEPLLAHLADRIICNSEAGRTLALAQGYPEARTVVVANGIDVHRFRPDAGRRAASRAAWGIGSDVLLVGIVGRLDPMKDHPTFLRAAALVVQATVGVSFVIVGDGSEEARVRLRSLSDDLELGQRLLWKPAQSDVEAVYPALDLLVSSSRGEGFPNVVGEAMACGVPCAVTDVGDSAQIVGETGATAPAEDPAALARAILTQLGRRSPELAQAARARIVELYSVETLVAHTLRVLEQARGTAVAHAAPQAPVPAAE